MCTSQIHWVWQVLIGFGAVAALAVNLYGGMTWGLVSLKKHGLSIDFRTVAGATSNCVVLLLAPRIRRSKLYICLKIRNLTVIKMLWNQ